MDLLAMGFVAETNGSFSTYTDALTAMDYPFGYGDNYNDTWELITFNIDFGFYMMRDSAEVMVEADASGTMTTPTDTYQNCLRIKRTTTYYSWFRFTEGGDWIPSGPFTDIAYEWYAPGIKVPVMIVDEMDGFLNLSVRYLVDYNFTTDINEISDNQLDVFPNPAFNTVHVNGYIPINHISLYSPQGKKLIDEDVQVGLSQQVEIGKFTRGVYIMVVGFENGTTVTRNIIKY